MSSASEVKAGLDDIASIIREERVVIAGIKAKAAISSARLAALPTTFSNVIATINAYPANTTNVAEQLAKAELAQFITEFGVVKTGADSIAATNIG